ncbi:MAG: hypothetical protein JJV97_01725 [SAR324 cluster bacterium]|nr:hypothetical protein [SAR324 cluster bacterium]
MYFKVLYQKYLNRFLISISGAILCMTMLNIAHAQSLENSYVLRESINNRNFDESPSLLILDMNYLNLSSSLAKAYGSQLALFIEEVSSFNVITTTQINDKLSINYPDLPDLTDCYNISCGLPGAKLLRIDYIFTSLITLNDNDYFTLDYQIIETHSRNIASKGKLLFNKQQINQKFFELSSNIKLKLPLSGRVLSFDKTLVKINLGSNHGITIGDKLVLYHNNLNNSALKNDSHLSKLDRSISAILKVNQVSSNHSIANYIFTAGKIANNDQVKTYLDQDKQEILVTNARKEIDSFYKTAQKSKLLEPSPKLDVYIPTNNNDIEKQINYYKGLAWIKKVRYYENQRELYRWVSIGIGAGVAYSYYKKTNSFFIYIAGIAAGGYSLAKFINARSAVNQLIDEGKFKDYIDLQWLPHSHIRPLNQSPTAAATTLFSYNWKF